MDLTQGKLIFLSKGDPQFLKNMEEFQMKQRSDLQKREKAIPKLIANKGADKILLYFIDQHPRSEKYLPKKYTPSSSSKNSFFAFTQANKNKSQLKINGFLSSYSNSQSKDQPRSELDIIIQEFKRELQEIKEALKRHQEQIPQIMRNIKRSEEQLLQALSLKSPEVQTYKLIFLKKQKHYQMKMETINTIKRQLQTKEKNLWILTTKKIGIGI